MTLCIGWIRKMRESEEICLASDSCFSGGQRFLAAPKLFPLSRKDCAMACAGDTTYSLPIVNHIMHAIEINGPIRDRAYDFLDLVHLAEDVINRCLFEEKEVQQNDEEGPNFTMILAGYSWRKKESRMFSISYNKHLQKMKANKAKTIMGVPVEVIGDTNLIPEVRLKLFKAFENAGISKGDTFGYQPLDVLSEYIDNSEVTTVGGHLQMLRVYPYMQVLPIGFFYPQEKQIYYYGRPLMKYETFPYPIYDVKEKIFKYMKVTSNEFELVHEETKPLKKFKGRKMQ